MLLVNQMMTKMMRIKWKTEGGDIVLYLEDNAEEIKILAATSEGKPVDPSFSRSFKKASSGLQNVLE